MPGTDTTPETTFDGTPVPLAELPFEDGTAPEAIFEDEPTPLAEAPVEEEFKEEKVPLGDAPQTGDNQHIVGLAAMMLASLAGGLAVLRRKSN